jgi:outer membrane protein OmpA-like peptidoglycan-associated protein
MTFAGRAAVLTAALAAAGSLSACGPKRVRAPERPQDLVVLLPDPDGRVGRATVTNQAGSIELSSARESILVSATQPLTMVTMLSEGDVRRMFGDLLSTLPPPPRHFTLYFLFESDELTDQSKALVPDILQAVKDFPSPEVLVIGHTDTTGRADANVDLGLKRAGVVRKLLVDAGLESSFVEVTSHGETDLLVPTADETLEPRNRRVEITVR